MPERTLGAIITTFNHMMLLLAHLQNKVDLPVRKLSKSEMGRECALKGQGPGMPPSQPPPLGPLPLHRGVLQASLQ